MRPITCMCLLTFFFTSCTSHTEEQEAPPTQPNFLFILVDDLGWKDLGFSGSTYYETPNIDSLAAKSVQFSQGYAGSRVCSPSRASIMTGKFTARHGITDWLGAKTGADWRAYGRHDQMLPASYVAQLPAEDTTLAEAMQMNGYKTFFAGKWHLGEEGSYPEDHGFDINIGGWEKGSPMGGYFSPYKNPYLPNQKDGENLSMRLAKETASFIQANKKKPFFAMLSFYAVHGPIQTNQKKWAKYRQKAKVQGIAENGFVMERKLPIRQKQDNPVYAGLVEHMDDAVGVVLEELKKQGLDKNTIVIFTSDNGGVASGDAYSTSNLPLKGGKGYQWEGGTRVPFLIHIPGSEEHSRQDGHPVTGADIFPTLLDYAGIDLMPEQHKDGMSLRPVIEKTSSLPQRSLFWHYPHYGNQGGDPASVIRKGGWKLIYYHEDKRVELYELYKDPKERSNAAHTFPEIAERHKEELLNWLQEVGARFPEKDEKFDAEARAAYEAKIRNVKLQKLEEQRKNMLSEDFQPNANWWGSQLTKD